MCGIVGVLNFDRARPVDARTIEAMCRAMVHRGPDDEGVYIDRNVGLGNRRLSIIGVSTGHQPMANEDGTVWITYNGEIYNHAELRADLIARGHPFKTSSDTEVIVHLYEEMGERCVERLQGMFAFAIWDARTATLLLARDRLGIKPLYYFLGADLLAFGSEIRALLNVEAIQPRLNLQALHDYLTFHYTIAPQTMIQGVLKLPPGHVLVTRDGEPRLHRYWDLDCTRKLALPEEACVEEFYQRFRAVTRSHLMSEVPLGVLLSGGLDSTAVTAVVRELTGSRVKTFSVGFAEDGEAYDERDHARRAAAFFGTEHHEIAITRKEFANGLPNYIWSMEEPLADSASVPLYYVSELARGHVTVILSGEGSDELLGGYFRAADFKGFDRARWARRIPGLVRNRLLKPLNDRLIGSARVRRYLELANRPLADYFQAMPLYMGRVFSEEAKWEIYGERMRRSEHLTRSEDLVAEAYRKAAGFDFLDQILYVYTTQWLPDDLLLKADKMTMAHSLELRVPFLDHTLVEFVAGLPAGMKVRRQWPNRYVTKYVLRRAFEGRIPPEILARKKMGFPVPLKSLFQHELRAMAWEVFDSRAVKASGLFDAGKIIGLLKENEASGERYGELWVLLVLCLWLDMFKVAP